MSGPSTARRAWRTLRDLHRRGLLTPRRVGCAVILLLGLAVLGLVLIVNAANSVIAVFTDEPEPVAGSPFDTVAPSRPPSSGSEAVDRIVERDRLIVAVREAPGLVELDGGGEPSGFTVALLSLVAQDLGVDPSRTAFKPLPDEAGEAALLRGEVDLLAAGVETVPAAAGPYLVLPHRLGVPAGSPVTGLDSLGGGEVCAVDGSPVAASLAPRLGDALVTRGSVASCVGTPGVVAVAADEAALAGTDLAPVGPPLGETRYGFGVAPGDGVLRERVQAVLDRAVADGTWTRLYAEHLGTPVPEPPG